jgi:hypothetical protein
LLGGPHGGLRRRLKRDCGRRGNNRCRVRGWTRWLSSHGRLRFGFCRWRRRSSHRRRRCDGHFCWRGGPGRLGRRNGGLRCDGLRRGGLRRDRGR